MTETAEAPPDAATQALVERLFGATIDTVIRPDAVRGYAAEAGFGRVDVLPIEHDFWRFYRLTA